jgi:hypothetical protein
VTVCGEAGGELADDVDVVLAKVGAATEECALK